MGWGGEGEREPPIRIQEGVKISEDTWGMEHTHSKTEGAEQSAKK